MHNGNILSGEKIGELVAFILNKFSEENLSCDDARNVLKLTDDVLGEYSYVKPVPV
jgi:hypothetical protein